MTKVALASKEYLILTKTGRTIRSSRFFYFLVTLLGLLGSSGIRDACHSEKNGVFEESDPERDSSIV